MINARRIFEFGSGYGYSAYWFARAVGEGGQVICTDGNPRNLEPAKQYLTDIGLFERIDSVSYSHLRDHETELDLVFRLLLEKKKS